MRTPGAREKAKQFTDSMGTPDKQESHRIQCVHYDADMFPERLTQPMVGSRICGEHIDTGLKELHADPALPENPVQSENALHLQRYSLTSDSIDQTFLRKAEVSTKYTHGTHRCQATFANRINSHRCVLRVVVVTGV